VLVTGALSREIYAELGFGPQSGVDFGSPTMYDAWNDVHTAALEDYRILVDARYGPGEGTVLQELKALQRLALVVRDDSRSGIGGRWKAAATARPYIQ
jgi:hypothetical protein